MSCSCKRRHSTDWQTCTLCRSGRLSLSTLQKASRRSVEWPTAPSQPPSCLEPTTSTTINDAFDSVLQYMNVTTRQCKRYHRSHMKPATSENDVLHSKRFHAERPPPVVQGNPLQRPEDIHVEVAPGTYAVSAGSWGANREHTHIVNIADGQTVEMTFGF